MDTKIYKSENTGSGVVSSTISAAEVTEAFLSPLPTNAPGVIVMKPGTAEEEHIHFTGKDAGAGKITGLTRDYDNRNGGTGYEHLSGASYEMLMNAEDRNNMVDAITEGYWEEWNDPTYASSTTFTVTGNQTGVYTEGRVVRFNQDNTKIGVVVSSSFSTVTTVTVKRASVPNPITALEVGIQPKIITNMKDIYYGDDTASDDDYEVALTDDDVAYDAGLMVAFKAATVNTGAATLNINSLGAKTIKKNSTEDLSSGDIAADQIVIVVYDGTYFQLLTPTIGAINHQANTTNAIKSGVMTQAGWGFIQGNGSSTRLNEAVTFPVAFPNELLSINISFIGTKVSSDPTAITEFVNTTDDDVDARVFGSGLSSFNAEFESDTTLDSATRYGYSWIALGR